MALTRREISLRYRQRHPERFTAEARRERRKQNDANYRRGPNYIQALQRYRGSERYKLLCHNYHLQHRYGISLDDKQSMWDEQKGLCGLCGKPLPVELNKCHVDHNHDTGKVRSLLHHRCNLFVGFFEKIPEVVGKVPEYLRRYE